VRQADDEYQARFARVKLNVPILIFNQHVRAHLAAAFGQLVALLDQHRTLHHAMTTWFPELITRQFLTAEDDPTDASTCTAWP
jgi:hypothetical protein